MLFDILFVIIISLLIASIFIGSGRRGPGVAAGMLFYFTLFLLFGLAASAWIEPVGPAVAGVYWVGPLIATLLLLFILFALIPPISTKEVMHEEIRKHRETPEETEERHAIETGVGAFFWIATIGLVCVIIAGSV